MLKPDCFSIIAAFRIEAREFLKARKDDALWDRYRFVLITLKVVSPVKLITYYFLFFERLPVAYILFLLNMHIYLPMKKDVFVSVQYLVHIGQHMPS